MFGLQGYEVVYCFAQTKAERPLPILIPLPAGADGRQVLKKCSSLTCKKLGFQFSLGKVMRYGHVGDPCLNTEGGWRTRAALWSPKLPAHFHHCTFGGQVLPGQYLPSTS